MFDQTMTGVGASVDDPYLLQANLDNTVRKIMDMEEQIERQVEEIARLELLVNESDMLHGMESELERASGIEILSVNHNFLEMRLTTYVPTMQAVSPNHHGEYKHELTIALDTTTMTIEDVQLVPEDVPYEDLVAEAKAMSVLHEAPLLVKGEGWSRQIPSLVSRIRHRIYANVLKSATLTVSARDSRYRLKYSPEANLVVATLPGPITANIEAPYGWPMPGFALRLNSLVPSAKANYSESVDILQQCVDLANSSPESERSGVEQFLEAIEKILVVKRWDVSSRL